VSEDQPPNDMLLRLRDSARQSKMLGEKPAIQEWLEWESLLRIDGNDLERHHCSTLDALGEKGRYMACKMNLTKSIHISPFLEKEPYSQAQMWERQYISQPSIAKRMRKDKSHPCPFPSNTNCPLFTAEKTRNSGFHLSILGEVRTRTGHAEGNNMAMEQYRITVDGHYERLYD
jgi:hypothetical protein